MTADAAIAFTAIAFDSVQFMVFSFLKSGSMEWDALNQRQVPVESQRAKVVCDDFLTDPPAPLL